MFGSVNWICSIYSQFVYSSIKHPWSVLSSVVIIFHCLSDGIKEHLMSILSGVSINITKRLDGDERRHSMNVSGSSLRVQVLVLSGQEKEEASQLLAFSLIICFLIFKVTPNNAHGYTFQSSLNHVLLNQKQNKYFLP